MCYRHATISFQRPCPECRALQCNERMYCEECGAEMPYYAHPSQCEGSVYDPALFDDFDDYSDTDNDADGRQ